MNRAETYYYTPDGTLKNIELYFLNQSYPLRSAKYNIDGTLDSTTISISKDEQFVFDKNKKLLAHWIGKNCYDEHGQLIMTRN